MRNVWSTAEGQKIAKGIVLMLCLNETVGWLTMVTTTHWYGYLLKREGGNVS